MKKINLRSGEVQEILSEVPHSLIRWGNTIILLIMILFTFLSWYIQYPETISTRIIITSINPPEKVIARANGKLQSILVKDRAIVKVNTPLAIIENAANYKDVFLLKKTLEELDLENNSFPFDPFINAKLGDIENTFINFKKEYYNNLINKEFNSYKIENSSQIEEIRELTKRLKNLETQKKINYKELMLQKKEETRYESLNEKGIVSDQEYEKHNISYLQAEKNYYSLLNVISEIKSQINNLSHQNKNNNFKEKSSTLVLNQNLIQSIDQLKKSIIDWERKYVLLSSSAGTINYLQIWSKKQEVLEGDNVFTIIPFKKNNYIGKATAIALNSGKIKPGQRVNIKLENFPDYEYGYIVGKVKIISLTPDKQGNLLLDISLPEGLKTSYKKNISFRYEMVGTGEIIIKDTRLIERILYQFRDIFSN